MADAITEVWRVAGGMSALNGLYESEELARFQHTLNLKAGFEGATLERLPIATPQMIECVAAVQAFSAFADKLVQLQSTPLDEKRRAELYEESGALDRRFLQAAEGLAKSAVVADAERYQWLKARFQGVDFEYPEPSHDAQTVMVFRMTEAMRFGSDLDATIDAARAPAAEPTDNAVSFPQHGSDSSRPWCGEPQGQLIGVHPCDRWPSLDDRSSRCDLRAGHSGACRFPTQKGNP